jgi:hypothetical protein
MLHYPDRISGCWSYFNTSYIEISQRLKALTDK